MDAIIWLESYFNVEHRATELNELPFAEETPNGSSPGDFFDFYLDYSISWLKAETGSHLEVIDASSLDSVCEFAKRFLSNVGYIKDPIAKIFGDDNIYLRNLFLEINSQLYDQICNKLKDVILEYFKLNFKFLISDACNIQENLSKITWIFDELEPFRIRKIVEGPIIDLIQTEVEFLIVESCKDEFEDPIVQYYMDFLDSKLTGLVSSIFGLESELTTSWNHRLKFHVYRTIGLLLMDNIFEIIRDFPDTKAALNDLRLCLRHSGETSEFLSSINTVLNSRLLIIDAKTTSILDMFLACKKCIERLELDEKSECRILEPIKACLKKDVARIILSKVLDSSDPNSEESLEEEDIESILDIFPTRAILVKEYQVILGEQLTKLTNFDVDYQMRNVEILKSRFGDSEMAKAHVMMKDVADSRRVSNHHFSHNGNHSQFSSLVISDLFWPKIDRGSTFTPPEIVSDWMKTYEKSFQDLKASRKLKWLSEIGVVDIEVKRLNDTLRIEVTPFQASVLYLFSQTNEILVQDAMAKLGCSIEQLRKAAKFWKSYSLLEIIGDYIVSLEQIASNRMDQILAAQTGSGPVTYVEETNAVNEKMAEIWPMIEGMLTNLGASDVGTIHRTLSMFMSDFSYDLKQFQKLLDFMANQDKLEVDGQFYKIKNS